MAFKPLFEHDTCGRCGGTGRHSWNQVSGSVCFGCAGKGVRLTKRGHAAQLYYNQLRQVPVQCLAPGMKTPVTIFAASGASATRVRPVLKVEELESGQVDVHWDCLVLRAHRGHMHQRHYDGAQLEAFREIALAYQASLNKMGKPASKRAKVG